MKTLKDLLWPTYNPSGHVIVPPHHKTRQPDKESDYNYEGLSVLPTFGTLVRHTATVDENGQFIHDSDVVSPDTNNGKRLPTLTQADKDAIARRSQEKGQPLLSDKAAFLKPYWCRGLSIAEAASVIKQGPNAPKGFSSSTIARYYAAFAEALPYQTE